ncbi:hypothetical protein EDD16DRAFT_819228 [Pisolithus croceorrhizus]|nr:hypothetical protein EDD16DRAFT_819228 [Pisolithus croceorrhizus]
MWDEVTEEVGSARKQELRADFWQTMIALGPTIHRFEGTTESAWKIINSLSMLPLASRRPLRIQQEMLDKHIPLQKTVKGRAVLDELNDVMSGSNDISRWFKRGTEGMSSKPTLQPSSMSPWRSSSLVPNSSTFTPSESSVVGQSVGTGVISTSSSRTYSMEGYQGVLSQVISALQTSFGTAELVRIHYLKNAIAPSLSLALFIGTTMGMHHAPFQVLEAAALIINVVIDHAKGAKLSVDVKTAVNAFAKKAVDWNYPKCRPEESPNAVRSRTNRL